MSPLTIRRTRLISLGVAITTVLAAGALTPAVAASASAPSSSAVSAPAATSTSTRDAARYGAGWLADQISANGGAIDSFGAPDPGNTAYAVIGLHAAGVGRAASASAITYLKAHLGTDVRYDDGSDNPGLLGYYILAAVSAGQDPYRFGGTTPANDLVARLLATVRTSGPDAGLFGSGDPTYDGAFRQGVALTALHAAHVSPRTKAVFAAGVWLARQQCSNGLWTSYRADVSVPCATADPDTFSGPDTNSTSLAVQGLAAYGVHLRQSATLASLKSVQSADGGFPYLAAAGQSSDPNSTALTVQALIADGVSPTSWRVGSGTPVAALLSYQLGCSDPAADRGAFFYPGDRSPNVLATVQAVPALAGVALSAVAPRAVSSAVPHPACVNPSTTVHSLAGAAARTATTGTAGPCAGSTGVTVSVDFTAFAQGVQTRCASGTPATGVAALQSAGFTPAGTSKYGLAFICRINSLPSTAQQSCTSTPPANAYWAYYHANAGATTWTYSTSGASSYKPAPGSIDAWAFGNGAKPSKTPAQVRAGQ